MTAGKWKWAFIISLIVNLFLIAVLTGGFLVIDKHTRDFRKAMPMVEAWRDATQALTPEQRTRMYALIKASALTGEDDMAKARATRKDAAELASKQPYDAVKMAVLSEQARNYENDARSHIENALVEGMANLSPAERNVITGQLLRPSIRFSRFTKVENPNASVAASSSSTSSSQSASQ